MELVFDGPSQPMGLALYSLLALVPLAVWAFDRFVRRRPPSRMLLAIGLIWFFVSNGVKTWDQWRLREMVRTGEGIQVTQGTITESWHIVSRERDWTRASLSYKTIISEGFDVGGVRFRWNIGDSFSPATFSNAGEPALKFPKGARLEVTWFVDEAAQNERRILRLRMGREAVQTSVSAPGFEGFRKRFVESFSAGDASKFADLANFPLLFAGHSVDRDQAPTVYAGLNMPGLLDCLGSAPAGATADGAVTLTCHRTALVFRTKSGGNAWQLVEVREVP